MDTPAPPPEEDPPSPCVGICIIGADGWCIGCFRTRDDVQEWWIATPAARRAILASCAERQRMEESAERESNPTPGDPR
jgi:hypothetical protein